MFHLLRLSVSILLCVGFVYHPALAQKKNETRQPVFASKVITSETSGHQTKVEANIRGATDLYLVVRDAGNGFSYDWSDWIEPTLIDGKTKKRLTEFKWKYSDTGFGSVNLNRNCQGQPLIVDETRYENGIGTHANSVIHFSLPKDHRFTKFAALAGLDKSGVDQEGPNTQPASVQFFVFTKRPPQKYFSHQQTNTNADHNLEKVLDQFDVHPELEVSLFAHEPMLVNPSNIDIDHLGRVWVCEIVNYRGKRNTRTEGDRILVLEDTDSDGKADKQTVFYQGRDIDSVHGVCVLGDRVIVSAGSEVFFLIDEDGDTKADRKEVLFTGISGVQHDHGIHAFVFGPDGKLYFNFGNEGRQIKDKNGKPIVDVAGREVSSASKPYQQGMVFRCDLDGSNFETLAWNFRNNWEVCVDSFGRMWQSDNDDDGNRGVRINFVIPFGNYGFRDEMTGAGWSSTRIGMAKDIPSRHWHLNDPGVVPNLIQTGAGSPTGICVYEGEALPADFRNQVIHCDAGPNIVRAYPIQPDGAGFTANVVNIMDGSKHNKWFRPSDVCVAPDGSLIVADWYDPGVGGHGMGDIERGRLFRVTAKGASKAYAVPKFDFGTPEGAGKALCSPNLATRYMAWTALEKLGEAAIPALEELANNDNTRFRARAIWALRCLHTGTSLTNAKIQGALKDKDSDMRAAAVRMVRSRQIQKTGVPDLPSSLPVTDSSPAVCRELLISLRSYPDNRHDNQILVKRWKQLAEQYTEGDRWYLEALGIAAVGHWDDCLASLGADGDDLNNSAIREIVWRSRDSNKTPQLLSRILLSPATSEDDARRFLRAFDFVLGEAQQTELVRLVKTVDLGRGSKENLIFFEAIMRVDNIELDNSITKQANQFLDLCRDDGQFVKIVSKLRIKDRAPQLFDMAVKHRGDQIGVAALDALYSIGGNELVARGLNIGDEIQFDLLVELLQRSQSNVTGEILRLYLEDSQKPLERRKKALLALGRSYNGAKSIAAWAKKKDQLAELRPAMIAALHSAKWGDIKKEANKLFPLPPAKDDKPLPAIDQLLRIRGNSNNGQLVFSKAGTCAKCHLVNGVGVQVGPDLSEIGNKLSRSALYESILFPSAAISHNFESWTVLTVGGQKYSGVIVSETDSELQVRDVEGLLQKIPVDEIDEKNQQKISLMPDDLHKALTKQDLADLIEYMTQLKKANK